MDSDAPAAVTATAPTVAPARECSTARTLSPALLLFLATAGIYLLAHHGEGRPYDYYPWLADAFLHGRLYLTDQPPWIGELASWQGRRYVVFPPLPAVLLLPFVAVFGPDFPQIVLSVLFGAANVALCYLVVRRFFQNQSVALWTAVLYAVGTVQWYHAASGAAWPFAQVIAPFFLWLALLEAATRRRLFLIGLCISAAFLTRLTTLGAVLFFVVLFWERFRPWALGSAAYRPCALRAYLALGGGVLVGLVLTALYNEARFGSVRQFGYALIPGLMDEPIYRHGWLSIRYVPLRLADMFTALPHLQADWPYVIPRMYVMAIWVTTPAFLLIGFARWRSRLVLASVVGTVAVAVPILLHGGPGYAQFGHRYSLDFMPFLLLLTASGMRGSVSWWKQLLIGLSIAINLWGVIMLSIVRQWAW